MDIEKFEEKILNINESLIPKVKLEKGISIIVPIYKGIEHIRECLMSFENQLISTAKFEVILVFNGVYYDELEFVLKSEYKNLDLIFLINDRASAGEARNIGLKNAKYSHVTFVDVDDYISENYIQANFDQIDNNVVTISQIIDVHNEELIKDNVLNQEVINAARYKTVNLMKIQRIATITTCKTLPKEIALLQEFRGNLRSGEDTVYFSELFVNSRPSLKIVPLEANAKYFRRIRKNSVSRKDSSFDFLVFQRLEILEILDSILNTLKNPTLIKFIQFKYNAQISFIRKYISLHPEQTQDVFSIIASMNFHHFNYKVLNKGKAETLVLAYCFPPSSDTSATIVSKRIIENNSIVDVVANNMKNIRPYDQSLLKLVNPYIGNLITVNSPGSFSNMYYLNKYIDYSIKTYLKNKDNYKTIYSRAMFPVSHIPGYFIKKYEPKTKWVAEFSDPLLMDIEARERYSDIENVGLLKSLKNQGLGIFSEYVTENLFNLAEIIPFALADELIFTNEHQLEYMTERFGKDQKELIYSKARISQHPSLDESFYNIEQAELLLETSIINIAYFGNFYSKRSYKQFIELVNALNENSSQIFHLHIFTNISQLLPEDLDTLKNNSVKLYEYLPYVQYLNALTKFDLLLINDAHTNDNKKINPYLPSKLSDYLSSGTVVLGITEKNSVMSKTDDKNFYNIDTIELDSFVNNQDGSVLEKMTEIIDKIELKKSNSQRYLQEQDESLTLVNDNVRVLETSRDIKMKNLGIKDWLLQPRNLPVTTNHDYSFKVYNNYDTIKQVQLKSYYSVSNVIDIVVYDEKEDIKEKFSIHSIMRNWYYLKIPANSSVKVKIKYLKTYSKEGFLKAGRLRIVGI